MTSVPLVYAAIGELVVERSGVLNLGVEGMMLMGAVAAFGVAMVSGSLSLACLPGRWQACSLLPVRHSRSRI